MIIREKKLEATELEFDYTTFIADVPFLNPKLPDHQKKVETFFKKLGVDKKSHKEGGIFFENKDSGIRVYFATGEHNGCIVTEKQLRIYFSGHFFIQKNYFSIMRKFMLSVKKKFGAFFRVTRVDIRRDIYNAKYPFEYFPDFRNKDSKIQWDLRSQPIYQEFFNEKGNYKQETGFQLSNTRYALKSYNRQMSLDVKYKAGKITKCYYDYYKKLYEGKDVQRLELVLRHDACKYIQILIMHPDFDKTQVLTHAISNFSCHHALKIKEFGKKKSTWQPEPIFAELFCYNDKQQVWSFKKKIEAMINLKFADITFSEMGKSLEEICKMLAGKIIENFPNNKNQFLEIQSRAFRLVTQFINEKKEKIETRKERFFRTENFIDKNMAQLDQLLKNITIKGALEFYTDEDRRLEGLLVPS